MTGYGDFGDVIVSRLAGRMGVDSRHLSFWRRGLTWYPGGLTQHIWVEDVPHQQGAPSVWRMHVRTWCLKRVVASSQELVAAIAAELGLNNASALIRKPGSPSRLGVGAAVWATADRIDWTSRMVAALARLQAQDALRLAQARPVLACGAAADVATDRVTTDHASACHLGSLADVGAAALDAHAPPFTDVAESLRAHDGVRAVATHSGVTASFPWVFEADRHDFMLFEMRLGTRPGVGAGVWVSMSLPMAAPAHLLHALALNEAELALDSPTDAIGGWIVRNQTLMHEAFLPLGLCGGEVVRYLADAAARRASWLRRIGPSIVPAEWPDDVAGRVLPFRRPS